MKSKFYPFLKKLDKPFYGALLLVLLLSIFLGRFIFQQKQSALLQFILILIIAGLFLALFLYALWKLNREKKWVANWAQHPGWVLLTFIVFPIILSLLWNLPGVNLTLPDELTRSSGNFSQPHFLFFYFWEALIFGIAFFAHPHRSAIRWKFSIFDVLRGIILGLGSWSFAMFLHEIIFQWAPTELMYQTTAPFFWPVVPIAIIIMPVPLTYFFFFSPPGKDRFVNQMLHILLVAVLFSLLPLRLMSILPAFCLAIIFGIYSRKEQHSLSLIVAYAVFNLFMLIINWQWVI